MIMLRTIPILTVILGTNPKRLQWRGAVSGNTGGEGGIRLGRGGGGELSHSSRQPCCCFLTHPPWRAAADLAMQKPSRGPSFTTVVSVFSFLHPLCFPNPRSSYFIGMRCAMRWQHQSGFLARRHSPDLPAPFRKMQWMVQASQRSATEDTHCEVTKIFFRKSEVERIEN